MKSDLNVRQPQTLDKVGRPHERAVRSPIGRRFVDDESTFVPRQVEVELEGHRQLNVVDPAHLEDPDVDVDVERALRGRHDVLVVVVWKAEGTVSEFGVVAVATGDVASHDGYGDQQEYNGYLFEILESTFFENHNLQFNTFIIREGKRTKLRLSEITNYWIQLG